MSLDSLLTTLELRASVTPVTPAENSGVTGNPAPIKACTHVTLVTPENNINPNRLQKVEGDDALEESHTVLMKTGVTGVTGVQANRDAPLLVTPSLFAGVTGVTSFEAFDAAPARDTRRTCTECANLSTEGNGRAASALGASRHYRPMRDQPRHCEAHLACPVAPALDPPRESARERQASTEESRLGKVIAMLDADPTLQRACSVDAESNPDHVIVTIAARGLLTCDVAIPRANHDPYQFLALFDKHGNEHE